MKEIKAKFHFNFYDLLQTFNLIKIEKLFFYRSYDYRIDLVNDFQTMQSQVYSLFYLKLIKLKKYLKKNFRKNFIKFNNAFYFLSILFIIKVNEEFRFCVNYCKLNIIIKQKNYFISFIDETLTKLIKCKYITKLNIIAVFNKLRMHLKNKDFITFICLLKVYKYRILSFDFINNSFNY